MSQRKRFKPSPNSQTDNCESENTTCKVCKKSFKSIFLHFERSKTNCKNGYTSEDLSSLRKEADGKRMLKKLLTQAAYDAKRREEKRQSQAKYDAQHREEKRQSQAVYNAEHREEIRQSQANYDAKHREEKREYQRAYYAKNKAWISLKNKQRYQQNKGMKNNTTSGQRLKNLKSWNFIKGDYTLLPIRVRGG